MKAAAGGITRVSVAFVVREDKLNHIHPQPLEDLTWRISQILEGLHVQYRYWEVYSLLINRA